MTGDKALFKSLKAKVGDYVTFGDGSHAQILRKGTVGFQTPYNTNGLTQEFSQVVTQSN